MHAPWFEAGHMFMKLKSSFKVTVAKAHLHIQKKEA
jgi:hypothetical protein